MLAQSPYMSIQDAEPWLSRGFLEAIYCLPELKNVGAAEAPRSPRALGSPLRVNVTS